MPWRRLGPLCAAILAGCLLLAATGRWTPHPEYERMLAASQRTERAFQRIKERRQELAPLNRKEDPNQTGLIGPMWTPITTTQGLLEAKRTTTNPNSGALLVRLLVEAGVSPGDRVAVNVSSSFPAVNIALLCALEELEVEGIMVASLGSSTYGATLPQLTYPDMEMLLWKEGILSQRSRYLTFGGQRDLGEEMGPAMREEIYRRLTEEGYSFWIKPDWRDSLQARLDLYWANKVTCLINVGGNLAALGGETLPGKTGGLLTALPKNLEGEGLIQSFLQRGLPVIHLLGMRDLYLQYGLPVDPIPLPPVGEGQVYFAYDYNRPLAWGILVAIGCLFWKMWQWNHRGKERGGQMEG